MLPALPAHVWLLQAAAVATPIRLTGNNAFANARQWGLDGNFMQPQPPNVGFPTLQGFQSFYGQSDQWQCHDYFPPFQFNNTDNHTIDRNVGASVETCGPEHANCVWSADLWTADAADWITAQASGKEGGPGSPWFLYLAYTAPHAGSVGSVGENDVPAPRVSQGPYAVHNGSWPAVEVHFATAVTEIDAGVGTVLAALETSDQVQSTVVFFSSDNGAHQEGGHHYQFFNSSGSLNGYKRSIHDGGHRAAFIVRWPGMVKAGSVSDHQLCFYDFLPTAAELAGISAKALGVELPAPIDGISFAPTLLGKVQPQPPFIYHEFGGPQDPVFEGATFPKSFGQNVRMGTWSGVCVSAGAPCMEETNMTFFLYDMDKDQSQLHDVSSANPTVVNKIKSLMVEQYNKTFDPNGVVHHHGGGGGGGGGTLDDSTSPSLVSHCNDNVIISVHSGSDSYCTPTLLWSAQAGRLNRVCGRKPLRAARHSPRVRVMPKRSPFKAIPQN